MVKSYRGVQETPPKVENQNLQIKHFMSKNVITFKEDQTVDEVVQTLVKRNISGAPVVNQAGQLCGVISEGDCLKEFVSGKYTNSLSKSGQVRDFMTTVVETMDPEIDIFEAADTFLKRRVRRFPVVKDGKLLGQLSQRDVMRAIQNLKNETW